MRSCCLLQSLLEERLCHLKTCVEITRSCSSGHIAKAKINSLFGAWCTASARKSFLFGSIPACIETLPLKGDNAKSILLHFVMRIYLCVLCGGRPVVFNTVTSGWLFWAFLWHWAERRQLYANNLEWKFTRAKFSPCFCSCIACDFKQVT